MRKARGSYRQGHVRRVRARRFGGLRLRPLSASGELAGSGALHVRLPSGYLHEPLYHARTDEWVYVLKGTTRVVIGGRRRTLKPGSFCHIPAGTPHQMGALSEPVEVLVVFTPEMDLSKPDLVPVR